MCELRSVSRAALLVLCFATLASAGNGHRRNAIRATRPIQSSGILPAVGMGSLGRTSTGDVQTLQQAYQILSTADHDYQGHRVKAMHAIKAAARLMGAAVGGKRGPGNEQQTLSDSQLRQVQGMLQQVRGTVSGRSQARVVRHVNEAINHLSIALTIK